MTSKNISKELICKESLILIQEGGLVKLSMRNLAAKLGIKAPSLYVHIKNKADLIVLLQAYAFRANHLFGTLSPEKSTWPEYLLQIMMNMRNFFLNNPNMFELFASYESNSEESKLTFEDFLTKMLEYGFSLEDAAYIGRTMRVYVIGQVKFELNTEKNVNEHTSFTVNTSLQLKHSADFFKQIGGYNHDKSFEFGANLIVNGCSKLLTN